jgi:hypothetical protein
LPGASGSSGSSGSSYHMIRNFEVGDMVRMSRFDIFEEAAELLEDAFEETYGEQAGQDTLQDAVVPIRIRYASAEDVVGTFIEADFDGDDVFEISVQLDGHHELVIVNNSWANA